jgi:hypothetical protein
MTLCYDPAKDWLRWVAEDLRHKSRRKAERTTTQQGGTMYTPKARALLWKTPKGFGATHCMKCKAGKGARR